MDRKPSRTSIVRHTHTLHRHGTADSRQTYNSVHALVYSHHVCLFPPLFPFPLLSFPSPSLFPSQQPPTTAQSHDPNLEDDVILDFDVSDVDNSLASLEAASATPAADSSGASASTPNPDAMEVDSVATPTHKTDNDSDPMDVSTESEDGTTEDTSGGGSEENVVASAATDEKAPEAAESDSTSKSALSPANSPTQAAASSSSSTDAPASPLSSSSSAPVSPPSSSVAPPTAASPVLSELQDPSSAIRVAAYDQVKETIIPCLQTFILDNNVDVRAAACDSLVRVADVLRGDDVGKVVLTLVLNLAHDERDEQRTTAVHVREKNNNRHNTTGGRRKYECIARSRC